MNALAALDSKLIEDVKMLVMQAKSSVVLHTNYQMTLLYCNMGNRIHEDVIQMERAEYGKTVVASLAKHLTAEFGKGFDRAALYRMIQFYESFSYTEIFVTLSRQLSWSHILAIIPLVKQKKNARFTPIWPLKANGV